MSNYGASGSYGTPVSYQPTYNNNPTSYGATYAGVPTYNDIYLTIQLGQAALIVFIIAAIVFVFFLLLVACMLCSGHLGGRKKQNGYNNNYHFGPGAENKDTYRWGQMPPSTGTLSRSYGVDNLSDDHDIRAPETSTSSSTSVETGDQPQPQPQRHDHRRPSRSQTPSEKRKHKSSSHYLIDDVDHRSTELTASGATLEKLRPRRPPPLPPQNSAASTSTDGKSLPRSLPYYEVPASRKPYTPDEGTSIPIQRYNSSYQTDVPPSRNMVYTLATEERSYTQIDRSRIV